MQAKPSGRPGHANQTTFSNACLDDEPTYAQPTGICSIFNQVAWTFAACPALDMHTDDTDHYRSMRFIKTSASFTMIYTHSGTDDIIHVHLTANSCLLLSFLPRDALHQQFCLVCLSHHVHCMETVSRCSEHVIISYQEVIYLRFYYFADFLGNILPDNPVNLLYSTTDSKK